MSIAIRRQVKATGCRDLFPYYTWVEYQKKRSLPVVELASTNSAGGIFDSHTRVRSSENLNLLKDSYSRRSRLLVNNIERAGMHCVERRSRRIDTRPNYRGKAR
jgi:hypothetical protein